MLNKLRILNKKLLKKYEDNPHELKKQQLIERMLLEEDCFFKINIETAFCILKDLEIPESQLKEVYCQLIPYSEDLVRSSINEEELD